MISGKRGARYGASRDTSGDDVVGCCRGRRQRGGKQEEPTPQQRRKLPSRAAGAARRRGVRLLRLVYVAGLAGIGFIVLRVTSSPPMVAYWSDPSTAALAAWKAESTRVEGCKKKRGARRAPSTDEGAADFGTRQDQGGRHRSSAAVRDSREDWRRRLVTSSSDDGEEEEDPADVLEELTEETADTAEACADNNFSGGGAGKVVLLVIAILFTFNGLAIVCDEFFQASLEKISEVKTIPDGY